MNLPSARKWGALRRAATALSMHRRPEFITAVVNGLIVLLLPSAIVAVGSSLGLGRSQYSVTVRPPGWSGFLAAIQELIGLGKTMIPFAALAAWRTWVHARRWRARGDRGWQGVAEAGACGFGPVLLLLLPGIVTRPREAAPYIIVYGGAALVVGLAVGVLLRVTALAILKLTEPAEPDDRLPPTEPGANVNRRG
jgi:hypothetical protein